MVQQYSRSLLPLYFLKTNSLPVWSCQTSMLGISSSNCSSLTSAKSRPSLQKGLSGTEQVKLSRLAGLGVARFLGVLKPLQVVYVGQRSEQTFSQSRLALPALLSLRQPCSKAQDRSIMSRQSLTALKSQWPSLYRTFLGLLASVLLRVLRRSNCTPDPLTLPLSFERDLQRFLSQRMDSECTLALLIVMLSLMTITVSRASRQSQRDVVFIYLLIVGIDPLGLRLHFRVLLLKIYPFGRISS